MASYDVNIQLLHHLLPICLNGLSADTKMERELHCASAPQTGVEASDVPEA